MDYFDFDYFDYFDYFLPIGGVPSLSLFFLDKQKSSNLIQYKLIRKN